MTGPDRSAQIGREGVSSEFPERRSEAMADYLDLASYLSLGGTGARGAGAVYARRLDARSVRAGQMSVEQFSDVWGNVDPYEILEDNANRHDGVSVYGGETVEHSGRRRYVPGLFRSNRAEDSHGDQGEGAGQ